jgi:hypothetical protein
MGPFCVGATARRPPARQRCWRGRRGDLRESQAATGAQRIDAILGREDECDQDHGRDNRGDDRGHANRRRWSRCLQFGHCTHRNPSRSLPVDIHQHESAVMTSALVA